MCIRDRPKPKRGLARYKLKWIKGVAFASVFLALVCSVLYSQVQSTELSADVYKRQQFNNLDDTDYVLTALKKLGFDDVFEVSKGAEIVSEATSCLLYTSKLPPHIIRS